MGPSLAEQLHDGRTLHAVPSLPVDPPTDAQREEAETVGLLLAEFLEGITTVILSRCPEDGSLHIDWSDGEGRRHRVQRGRPLELLQAALNREVRQCCSRCGEWKALNCFGADKARGSGRLPRCKPCECERAREYKLRKKLGLVKAKGHGHATREPASA